MTDEEMAEEYTLNLPFVFETEVVRRIVKMYAKQAFLAGLKAGRPEWHDLRKDLNDLPKSYMSVVNQDGVKVMYDYSCKAWRYDDADNYYCDTPIAWCEIPTFTDKE